MDTLDYIGKIIPPAMLRDAVHIAVLPMKADRPLQPGQRLEFGIVDPYLDKGPKTGEHFFLFLYPNKIHSLRHVWVHPEIPNEASKTNEDSREKSRQWLENFARELGPFSALDIIEATRYYTNPDNFYADGESICMGSDLGSYTLKPTDEFWRHYENFTGEKPKEKPTYFRCAC